MRTLFPKRGSTAYELLKQLLASEEERVCQQDPELWWMTDYHSVMTAKRLCTNTDGQGTPCPLLALCGEYAITAVEPTGVWGGMSPDDRLTIRRRRQKAKHRAAKRAQRIAAAKETTTPKEQAS